MACRMQAIRVSPVQNHWGKAFSASKKFRSAYSGMWAQYTPRMYSRQPRTWRMKPSTCVMSAWSGSVRHLSSTARMTSIGEMSLAFMQKEIRAWYIDQYSGCMASWKSPNRGKHSSTKKSSSSSPSSRVTGHRKWAASTDPIVSTPQSYNMVSSSVKSRSNVRGSTGRCPFGSFLRLVAS